MNIHEFQAKKLFKSYQIPVPASLLANTAGEAFIAAQSLQGARWAVKAQVHAGGRGKVGGVKIAKTPDACRDYAQAMLNTRLITKQTVAEGLPVDAVLIEKTSEIKREFYLSLLIDRHQEKLCFIASAMGGMDIEAVAHEHPEKIIQLSLHSSAGLQAFHCRDIAACFSLSGPQVNALYLVMNGLLQLLLSLDASQIEINPLVETEAGDLLALDAKINFDDNALALHPELKELQDIRQEDDKENQAKKFDLNYITLDGTIACMVNGAGLAMATMDLIKLKGGTPANFLDVGGGTSVEKVTEAFKIIVSDDHVQAVLVNIFGGIVQCDIIAQGILKALEHIETTLPIIIRLAGTHAEEGRALLEQAAIENIISINDLDKAAEYVVNLVGDKQ